MMKLVIWFLAITLPGEAFASESERVLIVGYPNQPLIQKVAAALQEHGKGRRSGIEVDVRLLSQRESNAEFVRKLKPPVMSYRAVFATSMGMARAVQVEDAGIPVVFHGEADPIETCLVDSMHRPGRSATGYVDYLSSDDEKLVEALVDGFAEVRTIYFGAAGTNYYSPDCGPTATPTKRPAPVCVAGVREPDSYLERILAPRAIVERGRRAGVSVKFLVLCTPEDFSRIGELARAGRDVGFVFSYQGMFSTHAASLMQQVTAAKRPAIYGRASFARRGGVLAMEPIRDPNDDRAVIDMLLQVIDGRVPATLPVQVPRGFHLTVNAAAAAAQGLQPSLKLLRRADEVILGEAR